MIIQIHYIYLTIIIHFHSSANCFHLLLFYTLKVNTQLAHKIFNNAIAFLGRHPAVGPPCYAKKHPLHITAEVTLACVILLFVFTSQLKNRSVSVFWWYTNMIVQGYLRLD